MAPRKIDLMHKLFGELPDRKCKDCQHLESYTASRKWYKCGIYGNTNSEASDWRLKWTACGMIDVSVYTGAPVVKQVRLLNWKPEEKQIKGQVSLFDRLPNERANQNTGKTKCDS